MTISSRPALERKFAHGYQAPRDRPDVCARCANSRVNITPKEDKSYFCSTVIDDVSAGGFCKSWKPDRTVIAISLVGALAAKPLP